MPTRRLACATIAAGLGLVLAWRVASAETITGDGYRFEAPAGFVRAPPEIEQQVAQGATSSAPSPQLDLGKAEVRAYLHELGEDAREVLTVLRIPGHPPPLDDVEFRKNFRAGIEGSLRGSALTLKGLAPRRLPGGLDALEAILEGSVPGMGDVRSFSLTITREKFLFSVSLILRVGPGDDGRARWDKLVTSLSTDAPPPASGGSLAYRVGRVFGVILVAAIVISLLMRSSRRRAAARQADRPGGRLSF